jgi:hypothetical protein
MELAELERVCMELRECRNKLMHNEGIDSGSLDNMTVSFNNGRRLLDYFPMTAAASEQLRLLEEQFKQHKAFKSIRMTELGWQSLSAVDCVVQATSDPQSCLAEARVAIEVLEGFFKWPHRAENRIFALSHLSSAVEFCGIRIKEERNLSNHKECMRLQVTQVSHKHWHSIACI